MVARSRAAVLLGAALGLVVVGSIAYLPAGHSGSTPYVALFGDYAAVDHGGSVPATSTAGAGSSTTTSGSIGNSTQNRPVAGRGSQALPSLVVNIGRQPFTQSAMLSLPIVAAVLFGIVLYRVASEKTTDERLESA